MKGCRAASPCDASVDLNKKKKKVRKHNGVCLLSIHCCSLDVEVCVVVPLAMLGLRKMKSKEKQHEAATVMDSPAMLNSQSD